MTYLKLVTPTNLAEEKEKFFSSQSYSPQFIYTWDKQTVGSVLQRNPELTALVDALLAQDIERIKATAAAYFDVLYRQEDIEFAQQLLSYVPPVSNGTADDVAKMLTQKLAQLAIDYKVQIVDRHGFQCRPDHTAKIIRLSRYMHLQYYSVESIVNHELVHIIRAVNGEYLGIPPTANYLPTEEGLACLIQDKFFTNDTGSAYQHALEYLASLIALSGGFRDVYNFFIEQGCDINNAWLRSIRQKYGLCDTSQPGSLMKSGMYFYHEQLLKKCTKDEILRLFVGKIPSTELSEHPTYNGLVPKHKIEALYDSLSS